jgi:hypothetical protein
VLLYHASCVAEQPEDDDDETCTPGEMVECSCLEGESGIRSCRPDGESFGSCDCSSSDTAGSSSSASSGGGSCTLTCQTDGFTYSCGTASYTTTYSYCSNGNVAGATVHYGNGHRVSCNLDCSGYGGSCHDDTGASCTL